jgi:DNA-binding NtrC family response regulator
MTESTVLLISRVQSLAQTIRLVFDSIPQLRLETCTEPHLACKRLRRGGVALVLIHLLKRQTDEFATSLLPILMAEHPRCAIVVLAEERDDPHTTALLRSGVAECLFQPFDMARLAHLADAVAIQKRLPVSGKVLTVAETDDLVDIFPQGLSKLSDQVQRVAPQETTVLLTGETGTGKTHFARLIHRLSPRSDQPFQVVDCCALTPALIESALFGHVRGAFTGADRDRLGKLASVGRGTLLLDEVNSLPLELQGKLLRAVDERVFEPVGGDRSHPVQARLIAASNVPLEREVAAGRFRADLYYRLNVVGFCLPPLREFPERVSSLVSKFLTEFASRNRPDIRGINVKALQALENYRWPGNIRELRNVVERLVALSDGPEIELGDLPEFILRLDNSLPFAASMRSEEIVPMADSLHQLKKAVEIERIVQALRKHGNNRMRAAAELGITRMGLYKKLRRYGINPSVGPANGSYDNRNTDANEL